MLLIDVLIRFSTITLLVLISILLVRDGKKSVPARYGLLVTLSVGAMLLGTAPSELHLPKILFEISRVIDAPNIAFVWWFGLSILKDDFKLGALEWGGFFVSTMFVLACRFVEFGLIPPLPVAFYFLVDCVNLALMVHLVYVALKGRLDDLVTKRRTLRLYFVFTLCAATALAVLAEAFLAGAYDMELSTLRALIILVPTLWGFFWLTIIMPEKLSFEPIKIIAEAPPAMDKRDETLHAHLLAEMQERKTYLEPELTIRKLSERLKTPEHRLRVLINQGLGYRNFSEFLNAYRIEAVKHAFSMPENARIPILTIALDAGYGSLAPFNRAFLKAEGITPTQFRKNLLKT